MKRSTKYNLLAKDEPLKEKEQQDWVEMQSIKGSKNNKAENHDTSYVKLEEEYSQIEEDNVHLNRGNQSSGYVTSGNVNSQQYKQRQPQNMINSAPKSAPNQKPVPIPPQNARQSTIQQQNSTSSSQLPQRPRQQSQITSQIPQSTYNSQYIINPPYIQRSLIPTSFVNNHLLPNVTPYRTSYSVVNVPLMYSQYQPQGYVANQQNSYVRQSQLQPSGYQNNQQQYQNSQSSQFQNNQQQHQNQPPPLQSNISRSSINQSPRPSYRTSIPEMTVNCGKCTFTQSVPGNSQMFICCMCNEIDECFPLYGVFTCGICKAKVIYPHGTSTLIKCTKCLTVNRVNPEPKKKQNESVVMGKEQVQEKQPILAQEEVSYEESQEKMRRDEPEQIQYKLPQKNMKKKFEQPFKVLPAKKAQEKSSQPEDLYLEIEILKEEKRQVIDRNKQFSEQLIELGSNSQTQNENLHKEIFQLSEKLDESLILAKQEEKPSKQVEIPHPKQNSNQLSEYPSIFD